jgi:8-oxo-dGTP pyrophosphatase MutT (NUDIX family)
MTKSFEEFINKSQHVKFGAAGIAILYGTKLLLVHPTNASWQKRTIGIPKGSIESGESELEAAIRETFEETGIQIRPEQLEPACHSIDVYRGQSVIGAIHYYICRITELSEIGLESERVPTNQLQLAEIDWAGFIEIAEAYEKIAYSQLIILDRLKS